ncbi:MAG: hypothetical protein IPK26_02165 [Planctomycetes bacterium]|nr:hypothetical protein [Planctomycetota bacterium]
MTLPKSPRRLSLRKKLTFTCVAFLLFLLTGELLARLIRAPLHFGSFRQLRTDMIQRGYPAVADRELGYVPRAGFASADNHWGTQVSIDADGLRRNGNVLPPNGARPLVAVGDSFTFGDQVDDGDSWPARLERLLGRRVANGGVFGYSFAQAILRAERLLARWQPEWLIVSFIPDDLPRNSTSRRYFPLPWFRIENGALALQPPADDLADPKFVADRRFKDGLGHSALLDAILATVARRWWIDDQNVIWALEPRDGEAIGLLLVDRIAAFCRQHDCRLLLVLQGERSTPGADAVVARAQSLGVPTLDLIAAFLAAERCDASVRKLWFDGHMTAAGNHWAAERIAEAIAAASR